jgi:hypothetical protein
MVLEYTLYPVTEDVLAVQFSKTEYAVGATPVPDNAITVGEFAALLVIVMLPAALPLDAGSNVALTAALCPLDRIIPEDTPLAPNPAPVTMTFEIVTLGLPALVSVTFCVLLLDTLMLPNMRLVALQFRMEVAAFTVRSAAVLVALPALFLTATVNRAPLSEVVVAGVV